MPIQQNDLFPFCQLQKIQNLQKYKYNTAPFLPALFTHKHSNTCHGLNFHQKYIFLNDPYNVLHKNQ